VKVNTIDPISGSLTVVSTVDFHALASGWNLQFNDGTSAIGDVCTYRASWSRDWSKVLFSGVPPGGEKNHVGLINIQSSSVTDLTATRQGTGFSSPTLWEVSPRFLSQGGSPLRYGSDDFAFTSYANGDHTWLRSSISKPTKVASMGDLAGHDETVIRGIDPNAGNNFAQPSPSGELLADVWISTLSARKIGSSGDSAWHHMGCNFPGYPKRWVNSTQLIASSADGPIRITIDPNGGQLRCEPILPPNTRSISQWWISYDRKKLVFKADGPTGTQTWEMPVSGPKTEPIISEDSIPTFPQGTQIFYPIDT
jgi:hypothetical protein